eukprot:gene12379-26036_t
MIDYRSITPSDEDELNKQNDIDFMDTNEDVYIRICILIKRAYPSIFSFSLRQFGNLNILMFAGRMGTVVFAGISLTNVFINVSCISLLIGMASASETLCSQHFGAGNYRQVGLVLQRSILILLLMVTPFVILWLFAENIFKYLGVAPDVAAIVEFIILGFPSYIVLCSEWWTFEILSFLASLLSTEALAAQSIICQILGLAYMIPLGFSSAASSIVGNAVGILKGIGMQSLCAKTAIISYYFIGLPFAYYLCFKCNLGVSGLIMGNYVGAVLQGVGFSIFLLSRTDSSHLKPLASVRVHSSNMQMELRNAMINDL